MAFVFDRKLAMPLWAMAFSAVALTTPPPSARSLMRTTLVAIAAVGIGALLVSIPGAVTWWRTSRALVRRRPQRRRQHARAAVTAAAGTGLGTLDEPNRQRTS